MRNFLIILGVVMILTMIAWRQQQEEIRFVALGDSYTMGTGVAPKDSWPEQLVRDLNSHGVKIRMVTNLAKTGKATKEVISEQLPEFSQLLPTFATIMVGANDVNRGSKEEFAKNLATILDRMLVKLPKNRIVVLTIPDFSVTPFGKTFGDPTENSKTIAEFNEIVKQEATKRNLPVVDVHPLSQEMGKDSGLVASDGLHPSTKEYELWEKEIFPVVLELLKR